MVFNVISWFLLEVWTLGLDIKFFIEKAKLHTLKGFFCAFVIICTAIVSQIPNMFPAIQYNDKKFSVEIAICVLLALSFFPIKSLILTVDWYYSDKEKGNKLNMFKENVLKMPRKWKLNQTDTEYNSNLSYSKRTMTESIGKFIGFVLVFFYEWFNAQCSIFI